MKIKLIIFGIICAVLLYFSYAGLGASSDKVIIQTNADEEAIAAMETALNNHGYRGEYIVQPQSTSELGGKIMAEGENIDADIVTQASYYLESAQKEHHMFVPLHSSMNQQEIKKYPDYMTPILGNMGSLFVNTKVLKEKHLPVPESIKDLTKPEYKNEISFPNIMDSSTGWLLLQGVISEYGDHEGQQIIKKLIVNAGPHLESSGSGPLKKVQSGEAAVGAGLRNQAIDAEKDGEPIKYIDPTEGNFSLTEAAAVVRKDGKKQQKAEKMVEVIQKYGRKDLLKEYPVPLYKGEKVSKEMQPSHPKEWKTPLNVDLLDKHQTIFNNAKKEAEVEKAEK
ncbi:ABC transporter substrate-binding protein [Staphylococcus debuckii]|uniref:Extracellular solute-binding protein n=1 Tax=Staphylococcus debuckii TaxID=2044912 RepID=A0ABU9EWB9_9STAP|nr:extracellular solute-binding protein [Staphylococcus debuckii]AYU55055.1 extracellular solute-binding protein [Staphylococcus debuckii]